MYAEEYIPPKKIKGHSFHSEKIPTPQQLGLQNDGIEVFQKGGRTEGLELLESFLYQRGKNYSKEIIENLIDH